ncbi:MAG: hypothetical protein ACTHMC_02140 [Pseudobacter sp.]|uniref:hypothetical protein n=1 Tax=Pseudobacter sp. TaxID=2045420 RepID=UPI003F80B1F3
MRKEGNAIPATGNTPVQQAENGAHVRKAGCSIKQFLVEFSIVLQIIWIIRKPNLGKKFKKATDCIFLLQKLAFSQ